jgi:4-amino-4-deoxy-L-arabinose transferase-like glycosyltransferase
MPAMSHCPYCRRSLPGFETLCQQCFEAGYEHITHPTPWWGQFRLTYRSLYVFFFSFVYGFIIFSINRDHRLPMLTLAILAFALAAFLIVLGIATSDPGEQWLTRPTLYGFLILFLYFFLSLWRYSSYHRVEHPVLISLAIATVAALVASFGKNRSKGSAA